MKIKIDKDGYLQIFRKNDWKTQECRPGGGVNPNGYENHRYYAACCDMCPLFGEPEDEKEPMYGGIHTSRGGHGETKWIKLKICKRELRCKPEEFEDER